MMKNRALSAIFVSALLLGAGVVHSQAPGQPLTTAQLLGQIFQDNAQLLEKQANTLKTLDALKEESQQIKVRAKRG